MKTNQIPLPKRLGILIAFVGLGGCASTAVNLHSSVDTFAQAKLGAAVKMQRSANDRAAALSMARTRLEQPLAREDAVRLALSLSPAFQALLADSASSAAGAAQSARLTNPIFTFERLTRRDAGGLDIDIGRMLSVSLLELIYLPSRIKAADAMQVQVNLRAAASAVETVTNVRQAWVRAVAAQQSVGYVTQVMEAAEASAELAKRMYKVGNFSQLQRARQQAFYAEATAQLARAKQNAMNTREQLIRQLGLDDDLADKLVLPARLPDLPQTILTEAVIAQSALAERLDIRIATAELDAVAARNGFKQATSFVNAFHLAGVSNSETGKPRQRGYELELMLPVFDWGDARREQSSAEYAAAMQRVYQTAVDASSSVREQYAGYRTSHALANHYRNEIVPLRKLIADEMLLKYNGMLTGVFDLLAETRSQISSVVLAIDAERDFWLADAALHATLLGKPTSGVNMTMSAAADGAAAH